MPIRPRPDPKMKLDVDLVKKTRDELDIIIAQFEQLEKTNKLKNMQSTSESDLSPKEKLLLGFIRDHPGLSKQQIVDSSEIISKIGTRNPVFRYLQNLERYGFIKSIPDEANSQIHHVFINNENRIIRAISDIEDFERSYLVLLRNAIKKFFKIIKEDRKSGTDLLMSISALNTHFIGSYILLLVYVWPKEVKEKDNLNRLYTVVFNKLKEVQEKISSEFQGLEWDLTSHLASSWYQLYPFRLDSMYVHFEKNDLTALTDPVLDSLWKTQGSFHPVGGRTLKLRDKYDKEDWREMLRDQRDVEVMQKRRKKT